MQFRTKAMLMGTVALVLLTLVTDPAFQAYFEGFPFGARLILILKTLSSFGIAAFIVHIGRRTLCDYVDLSEHFSVSKQSPVAAAIAIVGLGIYVLSFALIFTTLNNYI